jgi:hypothetical protein
MSGSRMSDTVQTTNGYRSILGPSASISSRLQIGWDRASQRESVRVAKGQGAGHGSASELLADWRAAQRDSVAAHEAASVAARATTAAAVAEEAAAEAETAAREARDAAARAKEAAERAKTAATQAADAAQRAAVTTEDDQARADQSVVETEAAESQARDRFHVAQDKGFPKD